MARAVLTGLVQVRHSDRQPRAVAVRRALNWSGEKQIDISEGRKDDFRR